MNKRILSLFVLGAAFFSVQAQQGKGGISSEMLTRSDKAIKGHRQIKRCAMPSATTISVNSPSIRRT